MDKRSRRDLNLPDNSAYETIVAIHKVADEIRRGALGRRGAAIPGG